MKIEVTQITKLHIPRSTVRHEDQDWTIDPIDVFVEDHFPGSGSVTITAFDGAWSYRWNGVPKQKTVLEFVRDCGMGYLAGKFWNHGHRRDETDFEAWEREIRSGIVEQRRDRSVTREKAGELWEQLGWVDLEDASAMRDLAEQTIGPDWWERVPTKPTTAYSRFYATLLAVHQALREHVFA